MQNSEQQTLMESCLIIIVIIIIIFSHNKFILVYWLLGSGLLLSPHLNKRSNRFCPALYERCMQCYLLKFIGRRMAWEQVVLTKSLLLLRLFIVLRSRQIVHVLVSSSSSIFWLSLLNFKLTLGCWAAVFHVYCFTGISSFCKEYLAFPAHYPCTNLVKLSLPSYSLRPTKAAQYMPNPVRQIHVHSFVFRCSPLMSAFGWIPSIVKNSRVSVCLLNFLTNRLVPLGVDSHHLSLRV